MLIVALQSATVVTLGVLLYDAKLPTEPLSFGIAVAVGAVAFSGLGLAAAALIQSAEAVAAVVNVIVLPMSFLSGSFGETNNLPRALEIVADVLPLKYLIELVLATYVDGEQAWDHLRGDRGPRDLGGGRLPRRPRPLRLGAARTLETFKSGYNPFQCRILPPLPSSTTTETSASTSACSRAATPLRRRSTCSRRTSSPRCRRSRSSPSSARSPIATWRLGAPDPDRAGRR